MGSGRRGQKVRVVIQGDIVLVPLTQGKTATVDIADLALVASHHWFAHKVRDTNIWYAYRNSSRTTGRRKMLALHHEIVGGRADHVDGNGLNNCRSNLRPATQAENLRNRRMSKTAPSGYKGVATCGKKWRAVIGLDGRSIHIGVFNTPKEAAVAYDRKALELHGEFASLNFK